MLTSVPGILGCILALAATILIYVFIMGKKKDGHLPKFLQTLYDLFNFKYLFIENILKFLYIFTTCAVILVGIFSFIGGFFGIFKAIFKGYFEFSFLITFLLPGLCLALIGPFAVRIVYELSMMAVLLVKNVIEINNKIKGDGGDAFGKAPEMPKIPGLGNDDPTKPADM